MKREIKICDQCGATNVDTLLPRLKELCKDADYEIGCQNLCGIGATKAFAVVDGIPVIAENETELVEKIKKEFVS